MADDTNSLLEQLLSEFQTFDGRLNNIEHRLDVMGVNWERTLRTWVRLERQGHEREQRIDRVKKNLTPSLPIWTLSITKSDY